MSNDNISNPRHYTQGGIEPIDFIVSNGMCFRQGNVIKYVSRFRFKGTPLEDLRKARQYLDWLIQEEEYRHERAKQMSFGFVNAVGEHL